MIRFAPQHRLQRRDDFRVRRAFVQSADGKQFEPHPLDEDTYVFSDIDAFEIFRSKDLFGNVQDFLQDKTTKAARRSYVSIADSGRLPEASPLWYRALTELSRAAAHAGLPIVLLPAAYHRGGWSDGHLRHFVQ